jgi:hypothetical protein
MKIIRLKALNMEIPVADRNNYKDLGYVEELDLTHSLLSLRHGSVVRTCVDNGALGCTSIFYNPSDDQRFVYIFYLKIGVDLLDKRIRAHEETHALDRMDALPYLNARINESGFDLNLLDYDDQTRACIGGWCPFVLGGQEIRDPFMIDEYDRRALEILMNSRRRPRLQ